MSNTQINKNQSLKDIKQILNNMPYKFGDRIYCKEDFISYSGEKITKYKVYYISNYNANGDIWVNETNKISTDIVINQKTFKEYFFTIEEMREEKLNSLLK